VIVLYCRHLDTESWMADACVLTAITVEQLASVIESQLVKPPHALEEIAARIARAEGDRVHLTHALGNEGVNGAHREVDPAAAMIEALAAPLEFPPLSAGIVPGDRVAIAVDSAVPCLAKVLRGAFDFLQRAGIEPTDISVVTDDELTADLCRVEIGEDSGAKVVVHAPADESNLCLVGATKRGEPLLINRAIFEADLVLPIGCARVGASNAYDSLFPRFSNAAAVEKYRSPAQRETIANRSGKRSEVDEAGWMVGVLMTVQVVPGAGESVAHIVAGEPQAVARRSEHHCREQWLLQSRQRVGLVVATVTGGTESQTWANVGRALVAAEGVLDEDGAIAICSNLEEKPGHSLGRLIKSPDVDAAARKVFHDHDADTWPAWYLTRALQRGPVYFMSQLNTDIVEDLGVAPVESVDDLVRLASRHESFAVVNDAQHAVVIVDDEGEERD
jgi:nickel-dependent lactate racemase